MPLDHDKTIKTSPAMTREYCVVMHMRWSEWIHVGRGFATRVVVPVSKLVKPQHGSPYTQRGTAPKKKKKAIRNKIGRKQNEGDHQLMVQDIGITPRPRLLLLSCLKAPIDKSTELAFSQVGHSSATVTVTLPPDAVVMCTDFPQSSWLNSAESLTE